MARGDFNRYRGKMPMADMNVVPLVDVMLVLLVIFIVTAPLLTHAVKLELPRASSQVNPPVPDKIEFAIDAQGLRYWNGELLSREDAAARFKLAGGKPVQPEIHLRADGEVAYHHVAETLADASAAGLSKVGFVSQPESR